MGWVIAVGIKRLVVSLPELSKGIALLIQHVIEAEAEDVTIDEEFYWYVTDETLFDMTDKPEVVIGQLSDTWAELQACLNGEKEFHGRMLIHLAAFMRVLGTKIPYW
jgi:hypothetical protein